MEQLHNGYTLQIGDGCFPLSTDSIALADFVSLCRNARVLDLGSGCATLGLLLCAKDSTCKVTGIELNEIAHNCALENIRANHLQERLVNICADLRAISSLFKGAKFDCVVSNPPYFTSGPRSKTAPQARHEETCSLSELFHAASQALKFGGDFYLVHKPDRFAQICAYANKENLEPKKVCLLRHSADNPISLVVIQCRKGAKPGLVWHEACLYNPDGTPTDYYRSLYHC